MPRSYPHVAQLRNGNARAGGCSTLAAATWLGTHCRQSTSSSRMTGKREGTNYFLLADQPLQ
jgi:hypothetical protein